MNAIPTNLSDHPTATQHNPNIATNPVQPNQPWLNNIPLIQRPVRALHEPMDIMSLVTQVNFPSAQPQATPWNFPMLLFPMQPDQGDTDNAQETPSKSQNTIQNYPAPTFATHPTPTKRTQISNTPSRKREVDSIQIKLEEERPTKRCKVDPTTPNHSQPYTVVHTNRPTLNLDQKGARLFKLAGSPGGLVKLLTLLPTYLEELSDAGLSLDTYIDYIPRFVVHYLDSLKEEHCVKTDQRDTLDALLAKVLNNISTLDLTHATLSPPTYRSCHQLQTFIRVLKCLDTFPQKKGLELRLGLNQSARQQSHNFCEVIIQKTTVITHLTLIGDTKARGQILEKLRLAMQQNCSLQKLDITEFDDTNEDTKTSTKQEFASLIESEIQKNIRLSQPYPNSPFVTGWNQACLNKLIFGALRVNFDKSELEAIKDFTEQGLIPQDSRLIGLIRLLLHFKTHFENVRSIEWLLHILEQTKTLYLGSWIEYKPNSQDSNLPDLKFILRKAPVEVINLVRTNPTNSFFRNEQSLMFDSTSAQILTAASQQKTLRSLVVPIPRGFSETLNVLIDLIKLNKLQNLTVIYQENYIHRADADTAWLNEIPRFGKLMDAITSNTSLRGLHIPVFVLENPQVTPAVLKIISHNTKLTALRLNNYSSAPTSAPIEQKIITALKCSGRLERFEINDCAPAVQQQQRKTRIARILEKNHEFNVFNLSTKTCGSIVRNAMVQLFLCIKKTVECLIFPAEPVWLIMDKLLSTSFLNKEKNSLFPTGWYSVKLLGSPPNEADSKWVTEHQKQFASDGSN